VRRAEHQAIGGQPALAVDRVAALAQQRDPEVDDAGHLAAVAIALDDHVLGLEVAVDQAVLVGVVQALQHRADQRDDPGRRHRRLDEELRQVGALREVHHHVVHVVELADVDHPDHVGVAQPARELGLALEALLDLRIGQQPRVQHLDRERAADLDVARLVDHAHRALAEPVQDLVALGEDLADQPVGRDGLGAHQNRPTAVTATPLGVGSTMICGDSLEVA
jgi:hypothetical protein